MIDAIKRIVDNLLERKKLMIFEYGTVEEVSPLKIRIDQKHLLYEGDLKLSHLVKDYYVDVTVSHKTESIYESWDTSHSHPDAGTSSIPIDHKHEYKGRKKILIHNGIEGRGKTYSFKTARWDKCTILLIGWKNPIVEGEWILIWYLLEMII